MITITRSASVAPGQLAAAMAFAKEIVAQVKATAGVDLKIALPVGGNATRIAWMANYENMAQYETVMQKILSDPKYLELTKKAAAILVPNTLHEEIWRTL